MDAKAATLNNLLALKLPVEILKQRYNLPYDCDQQRLLEKPSSTVILTLFYALFDQLDPTRTAATFKHCWPLYDRKTESNFRKAAGYWLMEIAHSHPETGMHPNIANVIHALTGTRLLMLLLRFSTHVVLRKALKHPGRACLPPNVSLATVAKDNREEVLHVQQVFANNLCQQFVALANEIREVHAAWQSIAQELQHDYRQLSLQKQQLLRQQDSLQAQQTMSASQLRQQQAQAEAAWSSLQHLATNTEQDRDLLRQDAQGRLKQHTLDGRLVTATDGQLNLTTLVESCAALVQQLESDMVQAHHGIDPSELSELVSQMHASKHQLDVLHHQLQGQDLPPAEAGITREALPNRPAPAHTAEEDRRHTSQPSPSLRPSSVESQPSISPSATRHGPPHSAFDTYYTTASRQQLAMNSPSRATPDTAVTMAAQHIPEDSIRTSLAVRLPTPRAVAELLGEADRRLQRLMGKQNMHASMDGLHASTEEDGAVEIQKSPPVTKEPPSTANTINHKTSYGSGDSIKASETSVFNNGCGAEHVEQSDRKSTPVASDAQDNEVNRQRVRSERRRHPENFERHDGKEPTKARQIKHDAAKRLDLVHAPPRDTLELSASSSPRQSQPSDAARASSDRSLREHDANLSDADCSVEQLLPQKSPRGDRAQLVQRGGLIGRDLEPNKDDNDDSDDGWVARTPSAPILEHGRGQDLQLSRAVQVVARQPSAPIMDEDDNDDDKDNDDWRDEVQSQTLDGGIGGRMDGAGMQDEPLSPSRRLFKKGFASPSGSPAKRPTPCFPRAPAASSWYSVAVTKTSPRWNGDSRASSSSSPPDSAITAPVTPQGTCMKVWVKRALLVLSFSRHLNMTNWKCDDLCQHACMPACLC
eukprot:TRINITY_DN10268_c0_g1_i4.p1 TRINITY_DN10268_c0_g1~~TRINITY_DN10268_c0_g1_i4.p1  ORF type:complete len:874 (+),score=157.96 TRINITY_DN10268_c0_g1_i4:116-2737(+)